MRQQRYVDRVRRKVKRLLAQRKRRSDRDWFDWLTLMTAGVGALVVVLSTVLTQIASAESDKRAAASLHILTIQAQAGARQASAAARMAHVTEQQLANVKIQLGEMKAQSAALSASASAANKQMQSVGHQIDEMRLQSLALSSTSNAANKQLELASIHNRLSVKPISGFSRRATVGIDAGIFIYNHGVGPSSLKNLMVFLDGNRVEIPDLEAIDFDIFTRSTPKWNEPIGQYTIQPGQEYAIYYTESGNINDWEKFRDLIRN